MTTEEQQTAEITNPVLGSLKISGSSVNTFFTVFSFVLICILTFIAWQHYADARDNDKSTAAVLKENNKVIAEALKESNAATIKAIERLTDEHRKSTDAMREIACLNDPAMRNRVDAREFCKRMSRDNR